MAIETLEAKPSYRVPSMPEIAAIPWNGLTVASTFSGCGGSCLGYRMDGYRVVWANELVPIAAESYRANFPDTVLDTRDIRTITGAEILAAAGLARGELDLLDGSPPCQPFSTAGKREKTWGQVRDYGDHKQRADDLFYEYVRLVDELRPRAFVAENVSGLVKGTAKGYFKRILAALKACGYVVEARLLDAQWLGVPQARQRIIFVGAREDLARRPAFPQPLGYRYSVRDALPWIGAIDGHFSFEAGETALPMHRPFPTVNASGARQQRPFVVERVIHDTGGAWSRGDVTDRPCPTVMVGERSRDSTHFVVESRRAYRDKRGAFGNDGDCTETPAPTVLADSVGTHWIEEGHQRLAPSRLPAFDGQPVYGLTIVDPEQPSPTVTCASPGNDIAPPVERRKFTIAELRRICAFPDDFVLCGSYAEQWARLGNAVPPVMMRHIAEAVRDHVLLPRLL